jgi:hypothetical protein
VHAAKGKIKRRGLEIVSKSILVFDFFIAPDALPGQYDKKALGVRRRMLQKQVMRPWDMHGAISWWRGNATASGHGVPVFHRHDKMAGNGTIAPKTFSKASVQVMSRRRRPIIHTTRWPTYGSVGRRRVDCACLISEMDRMFKPAIERNIISRS